jgi:phosphate transport system protein
MSTHLQREVEKLKNKILALTARVEDVVHKSVRSVVERDVKLAQEIVHGDAAIDQVEVDIEEDCLKLLALYQPVATDLRLIIAVLKINNDIERVGDLAVNIAELTLFLCAEPPIDMPFGFTEMCSKALEMLKGSLDALMQQDVQLARRIRAEDDEVDDWNRDMYAKVNAATREDPDHLERLQSYLSVSRHLERIADYATNIAEDVIYLTEGQIVRHKPTFPN